MTVDRRRAGMRAQFVRFLAAGGIAALANYGSRFLFSRWFSFEVAVCLAFGVGLATGFVLMRGMVFESRDKPLRPQVIRYVAINGLALLQTLAISVILADWLLPRMNVVSHREAIAHAFGVAFPVVTSYFGHRWVTFR